MKNTITAKFDRINTALAVWNNDDSSFIGIVGGITSIDDIEKEIDVTDKFVNLLSYDLAIKNIKFDKKIHTVLNNDDISFTASDKYDNQDVAYSIRVVEMSIY